MAAEIGGGALVGHVAGTVRGRPFAAPGIVELVLAVELVGCAPGWFVEAGGAAPFGVGRQPVHMVLGDESGRALDLGEPAGEGHGRVAADTGDGLVGPLAEGGAGHGLGGCGPSGLFAVGVPIGQAGFPDADHQVLQRHELHAEAVGPRPAEDNAAAGGQGHGEFLALLGGHVDAHILFLVAFQADLERQGAGEHAGKVEGGVPEETTTGGLVNLRPARGALDVERSVQEAAHAAGEGHQRLAIRPLLPGDVAAGLEGVEMLGPEESEAPPALEQPRAERVGPILGDHGDLDLLAVEGDPGRAAGGGTPGLLDVGGILAPLDWTRALVVAAVGIEAHAEVVPPGLARHRRRVEVEFLGDDGHVVRGDLDLDRGRAVPVKAEQEARLAEGQVALLERRGAEFTPLVGNRRPGRRGGDLHRPRPRHRYGWHRGQEGRGLGGPARIAQLAVEQDQGRQPEHRRRCRRHQPTPAGPPGSPPCGQGRKVVVHVAGRRVANGGVGLAGPADHLVQTQPRGAFGVGQVGGHLGELKAVLAGTHLVEHHAEAVDVALRAARTLRRGEALGPDERALAGRRDQPDVGQFRHALDEDDVGRLDVAVGQALAVQVAQRVGQHLAHRDALGHRQPAPPQHVAAQRAGLVFHLVGGRVAEGVVAQLHHVVIERLLVVAADVQHLHQPAMAARHRLELADPLELALERVLVVEVATAHDLDRAQRAGDAAGQPYLAVGPLADAPQQAVVRDARGWLRDVVREVVLQVPPIPS